MRGMYIYMWLPVLLSGLLVNCTENPLDGVIDEVRISDQVRSQAWLKLSYETQKPGSKAVEFK
jgi:hypothetical protein